MVTSITSKSDSVQVVYDNYLSQKYIVNRRYQRKLVWTQEEKVAFIDSLRQHFSVPIFLLAQYTDENGGIYYEIIDGMQRLNAISSFIEQEFPIEVDGVEGYFNLDTLASTLNLKQNGDLKQHQPVLAKEVCMDIVSYQIPFSFIIADQQSIEEIFRRINSFGKQLSGQEIRQAGAVGVFSDLVRRIASTIRGDVSSSDKLALNGMKNISLSNTRLKYGIDVNDIWWVKQHIVTMPNIRVSRDEELIAWILSYIILGKTVSPSSKTLNRLYRYDTKDKEGSNYAAQIEAKIRNLGEQNILKMFCNTFSVLLDILHHAHKDFRTLIYTEDEAEGLVRTFQIIFLALYEVLYLDHMVVANVNELTKSLDGIGFQLLKGISKANWTADARYNYIQAIKGIIKPSFKKGTGDDVGSDNWVIQMDNIMRLSIIEGTQYDFKAGFHNFSDSAFNKELVKKCVKILTAAANKGPQVTGYVIVGICESEETFKQFKSFYGTKKGERYQNTDFYITGIDEEVKRFFGGSADKFQNAVIDIINKEPIEEDVKRYILTHMWFPRYYDVTLMVLELKSDNAPITYADEYYERHGNNVDAVKGVKGNKAVEARFSMS